MGRGQIQAEPPPGSPQLPAPIRTALEESVPEPDATRRLAVPGSHLQQWHKAASQSGIDLRQWILAALDNAAAQILVDLEEQA